MRTRGLSPTAVSYGAAINACEKRADWAAAVGLLAEMSKRNVKPNTIVYSSAISACGEDR